MVGNVDLQLFSLGGPWQGGKEESWQLQNVYPSLLKLLDLAHVRYGRVVIAIDDMDKKEVRSVQEMLDSAA